MHHDVVDTNAPAARVRQHVVGDGPVLREDVQREGFLVFPDETRCFPYVVDVDDGENGAEDFVLHGEVRRFHVDEDRRLDVPLPGVRLASDGDFGIVQQLGQPSKVVVGDDAAVVRRLLGVLAVPFSEDGPGFVEEFLFDLQMITLSVNGT